MSWRYWIALFFALLIGCAEAGTDTSSDDDTGSSGGNGGGGVTGGSGGASDGGSSGGFFGPGPGGAGGTASSGGGEPTGLLPDPGTAVDNWSSPQGGDVGTTAQAWKVGTATQPSPYVQASLSPTTGSAFFVFTAGESLTQLSVTLTGSGYTAIHLHDGTGLVFGAKLDATTSGPTSGTWNVTPKTIYALEVVGPNSQFF